MTATLGDPHALASYPISQHLKTNAYHVFIYAPVGDDRDFSATIGVQGDGIHIVDLNTLQDDASLIAEPSTSFAAPPVSRLERGPGSKPKRYTYAAIERAVGVEVSAQRRTIWSWTSQDSLGSLERQDSVTLTHTVSYLFAPHWMPSTVLAVSEIGQATLLDQSLLVERTQSPTSPHGKLLGSFVFPSRDASFVTLSARTGFSSNSAILVNIFSNQSTVTISSILVDDDLHLLGDATLEHPQTVDVLSVSCSIDGIVTLLESGSWQSLQLLPQGDTFALSQIGRPINLTALSIPQSTTVALTSSHVLLASITSSQPPNIVFLLWDLQYSVLLTERKHPLPTYLSGLPLDTLQLKLAIAPKSLALLVVRPSITVADNEKKTAAGIKSLVLSIPYAVPESSSLKNALGKAPLTQKWIAPLKGRKLAGINAPEREFLKSLENTLKEGHIEKAEEAFFEWLETQAKHTKNGVQINGTGDYEEEKSEGGTSDGGHPKKSEGRSKKTTWKLHINYLLACALLATVLQSDQPKAPYSPKIMHCLLQREIVRDSMLDGGILKPLRDRSDWLGVELAMQNVHDIPEADLIDTLRDCISAHLAMRKGDGSTMDVDHFQRSSRTPLSLDRMVSLLVGYPVSAPPFRVALRDILSNAEEITTVLEVLATWVKAWGEKGATIRVDGETNERGLIKRGSRSGGNKGGLPKLDLIAAFLIDLLDSSLVSLLQYRPAHALLQQLTEDLEPQLSFLEELDVLRGPLEPFVRVYNSRANAPMEQNARQKEKEAYKAAEIRLGLYQIEELFL